MYFYFLMQRSEDVLLADSHSASRRRSCLGLPKGGVFCVLALLLRVHGAGEAAPNVDSRATAAQTEAFPSETAEPALDSFRARMLLLHNQPLQLLLVGRLESLQTLRSQLLSSGCACLPSRHLHRLQNTVLTSLSALTSLASPVLKSQRSGGPRLRLRSRHGGGVSYLSKRAHCKA